MNFAARRIRNGLFAGLILAAIAVVVRLYDLGLRDTSFLTGWLLVAGVALLTLYNVRKKLPMLPLLDAASWMQVHAYAGVLTLVVFFMHTGLRLPSGALESLLWLLFVVVAASGLLGVALTRLVPAHLTRHGERVIFERIPMLRANLAREVGELAEDSIERLASATIADYYRRELQPFFARPRNLVAHLLGSRRPLQRLCGGVRSLRRYLGDDGREILARIEDAVVAKDNLDYQHAWQLALKGWLFVHIPATYALILVAAVHVVLAYAFEGGGL